MTETAPTRAREDVALRLLKGTTKRRYDPAVDVDWVTPPDPGKWFMPPEAVSLYGTQIWQAMSNAERHELARQETASVLSQGIWFENTLTQGILRTNLWSDPTSAHSQYALTELGDETRHMVMFGRAITWTGAHPYRLNSLQTLAVQSFPLIYRGLFLWVAALCGEEFIDAQQRVAMRDERVQPLMRQVMQIHVLEEARHIRFAREGVARRIQRARWWEKEFAKQANGGAVLVLDRLGINPEVYRRCGLDAGTAVRQARRNPHLLERRQRCFAPMWSFFGEHGLDGTLARHAWQQAGFLPEGDPR
ncbi:MAG: AurF N-oxygenase family protein [Jatrophihabitans sp.]